MEFWNYRAGRETSSWDFLFSFILVVQPGCAKSCIYGLGQGRARRSLLLPPALALPDLEPDPLFSAPRFLPVRALLHN